jgi:type IV secretion system protein VirB4
MSVDALALRLTQHGKVAAKEKDVADFLPYTRHVDPATLATKTGELLQIVKLDGYPFETADAATLDGLKATRNTLAIALASSRHILYHHLVRREVPADLGGDFVGFAAAVDAAWQRRLQRTRLYVNDLYLTVLRRPAPGLAGVVDWMRGLVTDHELRRREEDRADSLRALHDATASIIKTLDTYRPRLLTTYQQDGRLYSEPLELLSYLLNHDRRPVLVPAGPIDAYLPYKRPFFAQEIFELRGAAPADQTYGAVLSIKDYADTTWAGMLDDLTELPYEMTVTQSFVFDERVAALDKLNRQGRVLDAAQDQAASQRAELVEAADDLASNRIAFGGHHLSILLTSRDEKRLEHALTDTTAKLMQRGVIAVREDVNLEPAYWAQLPGNQAFVGRRSDISSLNWAAYASLHNYPAGRRTGNHWGDCIALLQTKSSTPYAFNFHSADVGNFTVVGPTGSGKTVVLTFLLAQAQRHKPVSYFFDRDRGADIFIRALGGWYSVLRPGAPSGLNPLQLPDTPENRSFLRTWLATLVRPSDGAPLTTQDRSVIARAVDANYGAVNAASHRRLAVLSELFAGHELRGDGESLAARLQPWIKQGERAWLFDNPQDQLPDARIQGFDLTYVLDDPLARVPVLLYLFHRIEQGLTGAKTLVFLDEGWRALDDPVFEASLRGWLKTIRKKNGLVGFGTQSASDILHTRIGPTIVEQCRTQLFMPHFKADAPGYCDGFGLTPQELTVIRELGESSRCFLVKHDATSVVARLDLAGEDDLLAVLSGREDTVQLVDAIRAEVGDDPAVFLPVFYERRTTL